MALPKICKQTFIIEIVELRHRKAMHTKDLKEVLINDSRLESEKSIAQSGRLKTLKENCKWCMSISKILKFWSNRAEVFTSMYLNYQEWKYLLCKITNFRLIQYITGWLIVIHSYLNHLNVAAQGRTDFNLLNSNTSEFNCLLYFIPFF